jgi:hypothetical protein
MNVVIYGTGSKALKHATAIAMHFNVVGFVVSDEPHEKTFLSKPVFSLKELSKIKFDKIIICSSFLKGISLLLESLNYTDVIAVDELDYVLQTTQELAQRNSLFEQQKIDKVGLSAIGSKHINNARLLATRQELLSYLPQGSIGAEIGVAEGDFTKDILDIVSPQKLHLVDVWGSSRYGELQYQLVNEKFKPSIEANICNIHRGLSTTCVDEFDDRYFDWVYIDTDHSYNTTLAELEKYSRKIKEGGWILGHDYCMGNWVSNYKYGVIEAVYKFCNEYDYEIIFLTMEISQSFAIKKIGD